MRFITDGRFNTDNKITFTFSLDKGLPVAIWKIMMPLILLTTFCACILHWVGVL